MIILPIYLQKYILSLIINERNKLYKYKKDRVKNDNFILTLSLVCLNWLNTIRNKINIITINDININKASTSTSTSSIINFTTTTSNKYSLLNIENLKYIVINEELVKEEDKQLYYSNIDQLILKMKSLKRIILSSTVEINNLLLNYINLPIRENGKIIKIKLEFAYFNDIISTSSSSSSSSSSNSNRNKYYNNIDHISNLIVKSDNSNYYRDSNLYISLLKDKRIDIFINESLFLNDIDNNNSNPNSKLTRPLPPFKEIYKINQNTLLNVKGYLNHNSPSSITDLYYLIKSSPNILNLNFQICFDNLLYQIFKDNNGDIKPCRFCNNKEAIDEEDDEEDDGLSILKKFEFILESIKNHKKLKLISISYGCRYNIFYTLGSFQEKEFPIKFIDLIGDMLANNSSIENIFIDDFHTPQLLEYLLLSNKKNKSIKGIYSKFRNTLGNRKQFIEICKIIKENNKDIQLSIDEIDEDFSSVFSY